MTNKQKLNEETFRLNKIAKLKLFNVGQCLQFDLHAELHYFSNDFKDYMLNKYDSSSQHFYRMMSKYNFKKGGFDPEISELLKSYYEGIVDSYYEPNPYSDNCVDDDNDDNDN